MTSTPPPAERPDRTATRPVTGCPSRRDVARLAFALAGVAAVGGCAGAGGQPMITASAAGGGYTVPLADLTVGQAFVVIADRERVLVSQLSKGTVVAFSARCTHERSLVEGSDTDVVRCPAHGSQFDLANGATPVTGPATQPLAPVTATVDGDVVTLTLSR